ncbi:hypothetical protein ACHAWF_007795, partial [Thalassiosira exigua]
KTKLTSIVFCLCHRSSSLSLGPRSTTDRIELRWLWLQPPRRADRSMSPRAVAPPPRSTAPRTEGGAVTAKAVPKTAPVAAAATVELPPVVHAIGGSIGGALAILLLYPLERVRVELQSRETREALGRCNDGKNPTAFASGESSSPSSSGSFEVVSSLRSLDEVSFDVTSFADKNSMDEKTAGPIVESISVPIKCSESEPRKRNRPQSYGIIMQCLLDLHKKNELYRGASPTVTTLMVSNAVFFYALQANRQILNSVQQNRRNHRSQASESFKSSFTHYLHCILPKSKLGTSLAASSIAGAINVLLTNPLWVASLRIMESDVQTEPDKTPKSRKNLWNVIHEIARNEGSAALWNGTKTSLLLVSNPIIQHFVYEQLRLGLLNNRARRSKAMGNAARSRRMDNQEHRVLNLTLTEAFAIGALAKTIATVIVSEFVEITFSLIIPFTSFSMPAIQSCRLIRCSKYV